MQAYPGRPEGLFENHPIEQLSGASPYIIERLLNLKCARGGEGRTDREQWPSIASLDLLLLSPQVPGLADVVFPDQRRGGRDPVFARPRLVRGRRGPAAHGARYAPPWQHNASAIQEQASLDAIKWDVMRPADVCCGTGTIGLLMAGRAHEVVGIDIVPAAIDDARANAALNGAWRPRELVHDSLC
jgi:SAM-dependent methyltransferase